MPVEWQPTSRYEPQRADAEQRMADRDPDDWATVAVAVNHWTHDELAATSDVHFYNGQAKHARLCRHGEHHRWIAPDGTTQEPSLSVARGMALPQVVVTRASTSGVLSASQEW